MEHHTFKRADGTEIEVAYRYTYGSPPTYSPLTGADGGDDAEIDFVHPLPLTDTEVEQLEAQIHEKHADFSYGE